MLQCQHMAMTPKTKRNEELVKMKENNPDMSWSEIGEIFRIKKQTAFKIWRKIKEQESKLGKEN